LAFDPTHRIEFEPVARRRRQVNDLREWAKGLAEHFFVTMRNANPDDYEATPRPIIAVGNDYAAGPARGSHRHKRNQLLYGATGLMIVGTEQGRWVVPPQRAVWIPAGVYHDVYAVGPVTTRSIFLEPAASAKLPRECHVLGITPLARALLLEAVDLPAKYALNGRAGLIMRLLIREIETLPTLPLNVALPTSPKLAARCRAFLDQPTPHETIDTWCAALNMSRRSFTRAFREETGTSFSAWCRKASVVAALPRLAAGESVTAIALDFGYANPSAFTQMFKSVTGVPPSAYATTNAVATAAAH
jgi:AraC-like DNA-binding protein